MGITPIPGMCGVTQTSQAQSEREVEPAFALTRLARMQDDAYQGNQESAERGMEEEDCEPDETLKSNQSMPVEDESRTGLDVFA